MSFDGDRKITQIRQSWDQGSLLKLIDVIGRTGRNWPISDGQDQIKLIANSVKSAGKLSGNPVPAQEDGGLQKSRGNSNNVTRDPHASLSLFAPRERNTNEAQPGVVPPRASAKPPPRNYHDLFVGNESDQSPASPTKDFAEARDSFASPTVGIAKGGAGKNFAQSRLFDRDDVSESTVRPSPNKPLNPNKYQHFAFADGSDEQDAPQNFNPKGGKSKHGSQWNFDDFNTPAKVVPTKKLGKNETRHWGNSDDEVLDSPVKVKKVDKPRRDAETHFEFKDDGTPPGGPRPTGRPRGTGGNSGMGLYTNNLYEDDMGGTRGGNEPKTVKSIANTNDRRKDFDPHFEMTDDSPVTKEPRPHISDDRAKAIKMMESNWKAYDSPNQKENVPSSPSNSRPFGSSKGPLSETTNMPIRLDYSANGINIAGDGMGSRRSANNQEISHKPITVAGDGMGSRKVTTNQEISHKPITVAGDGMGSRKATTNQEISHKPITVAGDGMGSRKVVGGPTHFVQKGINVGGDGMGGKKGSGRQWGFGDESDGEDQQNGPPARFQTGKTQGKQQATGGDFWDF